MNNGVAIHGRNVHPKRFECIMQVYMQYGCMQLTKRSQNLSNWHELLKVSECQRKSSWNFFLENYEMRCWGKNQTRNCDEPKFRFDTKFQNFKFPNSSPERLIYFSNSLFPFFVSSKLLLEPEISVQKIHSEATFELTWQGAVESSTSTAIWNH